MKLASPDWGNTLNWDALHPASLVLEHPKLYMQVVSDLTAQIHGDDGRLVCSEGFELIPLAKSAVLIRDLWAVDVNQKKLLNGVLTQLKTIAQEDYEQECQDVLCRLAELMGNISQSAMLPLVWEDTPDILTVFKALGVRLDSVENPKERLIDYIRLAQEFLHTKLAILVGVRCCFTQEELVELCYDVKSAGLTVLFVDPYSHPMLPNEVRLLIDGDYCELSLP